MSKKTTLQTYVAFIVPDSRAPEKGIPVPFAVESRSLADLDVPERACAFYFYDAPAGLSPQESLDHKQNASKEYLLANETMTRHEIKVLLAGEHYKSLEGRMQWDTRVEDHEIFIITRNSSVQPVTENHVVLNSRMTQIYPHTPPDENRTIDPKKLPGLYNPVLHQDVLVPRMGDVRRRKHNTPPHGQ